LLSVRVYERDKCVKCQRDVTGRFRLVWDAGGYRRMCGNCSARLEAFVAEYGPIGLVSMQNPVFTFWLEEERFPDEEDKSA